MFFCTNLPVLKLTTVDETIRKLRMPFLFLISYHFIFFEPEKITIRLVDVLKTSNQQSIFPDSSWLKRLQRQEWIFVPPMVMETVGLDTASGQPLSLGHFSDPKTLVVETLNVMCMKVMIDN